MFALATMFRDPSGEAIFKDGILYSLPIELRDAPRLRSYAKISKPGWDVLEFGYHAFSSEMPRGGLLTFPGLNITDAAKVNKHFHGYSASFTRRQVENLASGIVTLANSAAEAAQRDQGVLIHDLRVLSNAIYNSALEAQRFISSANYYECKKRIENVIASQGMLRMRTDALDFVGDAIGLPSDVNIEIFKKIDKVVRCFKSRAASQQKFVDLGGSTYRRTRGPDILELIPYGLIDNGLKYSPENGTVAVEVSVEGENTIVSVTSMGPRIEPHEVGSIFSKGVRGTAAIATAIPGSGIGLHMVHKIATEMFGGSINASQVPVPVFQNTGTPYYQTTFEVSLPSFV